MALRDADARPEVRRLDEDRIAQLVRDARRDRRWIALPARGAVTVRCGHDRQAAGGEERLHHGLVHADGRPEHAGADIRDVGQLEQTLHGPVFAIRTVQHRKDHVDDARMDGRGRLDRLQRPLSV